MTTSLVWVKLRGSRADAFRVEVGPSPKDNIDFLKKAIKAETGEKVEFIYTEEYSPERSDEQNEANKCEPDASITSHDQVGKGAKCPYYYTIASPAIQPQEAGK